MIDQTQEDAMCTASAKALLSQAYIGLNGPYPGLAREALVVDLAELLKAQRMAVREQYSSLVEAAKAMRDAQGLLDQAKALGKIDAALDKLGVSQ